MIVFKRVPPTFVIKFARFQLGGLVLIVMATWLANRFIEIEEPTTLLPSIAVFGTVMSLFLAFKTNESYNRWWEARMLWGALVNYSRTFGRQVTNLLTLNIGLNIESSQELESIQKEMIYRHVGYINALRLSLRRQNQPEELAPFLEPQELDRLKEYANLPTQLIQQQASRLKEIFQNNGNDFRYMQMDSTLNEFYNIQGACERINNTVFPRVYSHLTTIFTWVFAFSLIFSLYDELNWQILVMRTIVAFVFLTLEKISRKLKDPFENDITDTPMTALCRTIEIDLRQMLGEKEVPAPIEPIKGVLY